MGAFELVNSLVTTVCVCLFCCLVIQATSEREARDTSTCRETNSLDLSSTWTNFGALSERRPVRSPKETTLLSLMSLSTVTSRSLERASCPKPHSLSSARRFHTTPRSASRLLGELSDSSREQTNTQRHAYT